MDELDHRPPWTGCLTVAGDHSAGCLNAAIDPHLVQTEVARLRLYRSTLQISVGRLSPLAVDLAAHGTCSSTTSLAVSTAIVMAMTRRHGRTRLHDKPPLAASRHSERHRGDDGVRPQCLGHASPPVPH